jgi:hypothetical protein
MMMPSGHTLVLRVLKQRSVSGVAPVKVESVVTIRKDADQLGVFDREKVAVSKKFLGTRHRVPCIWISTGVVSRDGA